MRLHNGEPLPKCPVCQKIFKSMSSINAHMKNHSGEWYLCKICPKLFSDKATYNQHVQIHKGNAYKCKTCGETFSTKSLVKQHGLRVHINEKRYACNLCSKRFRYKTSVAVHLKNKTCQKTTTYRCCKCRKTFKYQSKLDMHKEIKCIDFKCTVCSKLFYTRRRLIEHMKIHSEVKQYRCKQCGREFSQWGSLTNHIRWHTRRVDCMFCSATFTSNKELRDHFKIEHTTINPSYFGV
jgi:DNA-directed RNA polymerase subunit RPC12/RpoP